MKFDTKLESDNEVESDLNIQFRTATNGLLINTIVEDTPVITTGVADLYVR